MNEVVPAVKKNLDLSQNRPIKEAVYEALRKTILLGEIPSGERINEKNLSENLNISRTPIRYALERLDEEDLVERKTGIGVVVKGISINDAYEIFDIRKELDVLAIRKAMRLMTPDQFRQMRALLEETDRLNAAGRVSDVMAKFTEFNNFIYDASHMLRLKMIVNQLQNYLIYFRDISINGDDRRNLAIQEHWLLYRGMLNRDDDQIKLITREHLEHSLQYILKVMKAKHIE